MVTVYSVYGVYNSDLEAYEPITMIHLSDREAIQCLAVEILKIKDDFTRDSVMSSKRFYRLGDFNVDSLSCPYVPIEPKEITNQVHEFVNSYLKKGETDEK